MSLALKHPAEVDSRYEIVNGVRVEKPPIGDIQTWIASLLLLRLGDHARANGLGRVVCEMLFRFPATGTPQRRPDLAYLSYERWPRTRKLSSNNGFDGVPDLAIEVISPSNSADEVIGRIAEYFQAGVRQVWVIYPIGRLVYRYDSPSKTTILTLADDLDGGDLLPGFRLSLAELFEDVADD